MNTVNIRIAPINGIHRGGLVIMSKKKTHDTGKKDRQREREYRTEATETRETKTDTSAPQKKKS